MRIEPSGYAAGMARQLERLRQARAAGMARCGWKIGINVPEILERLSLPHPGVGWLDGRQVRGSGSRVAPVPGSRLHVEPEVALRIGRRVPAGCSASEAGAYVDALHPALELLDYAKPSDGLADVVSHCMFHWATVLGDPVPVSEAVELGATWPLLDVAGQPPPAPRSDLVPADLGQLVAFAADFLAAFDESLLEGDLLLSGAYLPRALALEPGARAIADFGPAGAVSVEVGEPDP